MILSTASGNSKDPGTSWIDMFEGRTPERKREERAPETRAETIVGFQRAWMMAIFKGEPRGFLFVVRYERRDDSI